VGEIRSDQISMSMLEKRRGKKRREEKGMEE
jgi:hypothetical protein